MSFLPTLVCVHAHPDDEAFFAAGAVAHYADLGHRVVLITCTNGQLGIDQAGRAGSDPAHDSLTTRSVRAGELQRAAALLGFSRAVSLGYDDSGMAGWTQNERPSAFMNADVDAVAETLASIFDEEQAVVVVTYDEKGFYGHPDHVMANVVTRRALDFAKGVERLYYPVVPRGVITTFVDGARDLGLSLPAWVLEAGTNVPDELVTTTLDARDYATQKQAAMATHASQVDNDDVVRMNEDLFTLLFGTEYYQRAWSRYAANGDHADLFGGLSWD
jgi:LmbE family N-acetylglucosaminyl deacetylase